LQRGNRPAAAFGRQLALHSFYGGEDDRTDEHGSHGRILDIYHAELTAAGYEAALAGGVTAAADRSD
jgi:hypothetical protein